MKIVNPEDVIQTAHLSHPPAAYHGKSLAPITKNQLRFGMFIRQLGIAIQYLIEYQTRPIHSCTAQVLSERALTEGIMLLTCRLGGL